MGIEEYSVDKQPFTTSIFIIKSTKDYTFFWFIPCLILVCFLALFLQLDKDLNSKL